MKPPAFQFYAADFMMGTFALTAEEVGAYIRLLCIQWDSGSLPDDDAKLARLAGCSSAAVQGIRGKFESKGGLLTNRRLESERIKQAEYRAAQSDNGRMGASKRWHGGANGGAIATPMANGMAKNSSPTPTPTPTPISDSYVGRGKPLPDNEWIAALKKSRGYEGLDIDREIAKCRHYCEAKHKPAPSRAKILGWLNRCETPLFVTREKVRMPANVAAVEAVKATP